MTLPEAPALFPFIALIAGCVWLAVRTLKGCYDD